MGEEEGGDDPIDLGQIIPFNTFRNVRYNGVLAPEGLPNDFEDTFTIPLTGIISLDYFTGRRPPAAVVGDEEKTATVGSGGGRGGCGGDGGDVEGDAGEEGDGGGEGEGVEGGQDDEEDGVDGEHRVDGESEVKKGPAAPHVMSRAAFERVVSALADPHRTMLKRNIRVPTDGINEQLDVAAVEAGEAGGGSSGRSSIARPTFSIDFLPRLKLLRLELAEQYISCAQLQELFARQLNFGNITERWVELTVACFNRIWDLENLMATIGAVHDDIRVALAHRLGWLVLFSPMAPDGRYEKLDLGIRDQRRFAEIMVRMADVEPGENWDDEGFEDPVDKPGWDLPLGWIAAVPDRGVLRFTYTSTAAGCKPDWDERRELCKLVLCGEADMVVAEDENEGGMKYADFMRLIKEGGLGGENTLPGSEGVEGSGGGEGGEGEEGEAGEERTLPESTVKWKHDEAVMEQIKVAKRRLSVANKAGDGERILGEAYAEFEQWLNGHNAGSGLASCEEGVE